MPANVPSAVELMADDVIAVMIHEDAAYDTAVNDYGLLSSHMPNVQYKTAMDVIGQLRRENIPCHDTLILERASGVLSLEWIAQRHALYDKTRSGQVFAHSCVSLRKHGVETGLVRLLNTAVDQVKNREKSTDVLMNQLMDILANLNTGDTIQGETARAIGSELRALMDSEPVPLLSTGLQWLDELTGGFERGHLWWIAGAYKQRKSTLMLVLALNALMQGASVAIASREMPRRRVAAQMCAMLAAAYLLQQGVYHQADKDGHPLNNINATMLMQTRKNYRYWNKIKVAAVDYAIAKFNSFDQRLRVYDSSVNGGSLADYASFERVMLRDKSRYGTDLILVDYMQLFDAPGKTSYEKASELSIKFQRFTSKQNVTMIVLAQKNEESIKGGKSSYSPGIKGGGDAPATADFLLETHYKSDGEDADDTLLRVVMKLSRHGVMGVDQTFQIHPGSGLFLSSTWIRKEANTRKDAA